MWDAVVIAMLPPIGVSSRLVVPDIAALEGCKAPNRVSSAQQPAGVIGESLDQPDAPVEAPSKSNLESSALTTRPGRPPAELEEADSET